MSQTTAAAVLEQHNGFLISDNIKQYASGFLTDSEQQQARQRIAEAAILRTESLYKRLESAQADVTRYSKAIKNAVTNGEPENSGCILIWQERYFSALERVEQLEAILNVA